ncbi:MAG: hypothetical protein BWY57_00815 [Betaproteobacteria bacterium ADurb.Bin341]|nr:MAG: hypothetical protein BWY57_00815 [Betaproteobacteria bacterium ADurb.Bin341]
MNTPESIKEIEAASQELAREFVLGNLIKAASKRFKSLAVPYMELKQHEQTKLLEDLEKDCRDAVNDAIDLIASNQRLTFRAAVDQVVFKDGVKAVLTMGKTEEAHSLADAEGSYVTVVIEDRSTLLQVGDATQGDPDQKPLFGDR